jgi:hypothetical protein
MSYVTEFPAAEPQEAVTHFLRRLSVETDCADVHHAIAIMSRTLFCCTWWEPGAVCPSSCAGRSASAVEPDDR